MNSIHYDDSRKGISLFRFIGEVPDAEFDEYLVLLDRLLERRERTVTIVDSTRAVMTPSQQRRKQGEWLRRQRDALKLYSVGTAFVFESAVQRFVLTGIFLIQTLPTPYKVCSSVAEAIAWAETMLASPGADRRAPTRG